jgi:hypothetical protein
LSASITCSGEMVFLELASQTEFDCAEINLTHSDVSGWRKEGEARMRWD